VNALCGVFVVAARHSDPIGIGGGAPTYHCWVDAQTAVDAYPHDFTAARHHGDAMTRDDFISYTVDTLELPLRVGGGA
jgi:hypothetical protein